MKQFNIPTPAEVARTFTAQQEHDAEEVLTRAVAAMTSNYSGNESYGFNIAVNKPLPPKVFNLVTQELGRSGWVVEAKGSSDQRDGDSYWLNIRPAGSATSYYEK